jgi:hypothetical protein
MSRNFGLFFALPRSARSVSMLPIHTSASAAAIAATAPRNPASSSSAPPRKKPAPFSAFFEPVSAATQRYSAPSRAGGHQQLHRALGAHLVEILGDARERLRRHHPRHRQCSSGHQQHRERDDLQPEPDVHGAIQSQMRPQPAADQVGHDPEELVEQEQQRDLERAGSRARGSSSTTSMRSAPSVSVKAQ